METLPIFRDKVYNITEPEDVKVYQLQHRMMLQLPSVPQMKQIVSCAYY